MKRLARALALATLAALVPLAASHAAPAGARTSAVLHVVSSLQGHASWKHVMASAKLKYLKGDVTIAVTADNLPMPSTLGKKAYVLFASDGAMTDRVGALVIHGNMASVKGQAMMTKVADLYVYAMGKPNAKLPGKGILVLSAMVG